MRKFLLTLVLLAFSLSAAACGGEEVEDCKGTVLDIQEYAPYFEAYLNDGEFVGYVAGAVYHGERYIYGLVYENPDGDYIATPLEALITLKEQDSYELVARDKIDSNEIGGFEYPIASGEFYNCLALDIDGKVFIQGVAPSFSDYPVIHQILGDENGLLDFYETINGKGEIIPSNEEYYTEIDDHWQVLSADDEKISYTAAEVEGLRPTTAPEDVVISYEYFGGSPDDPEFKVDDKVAPVILEEFGGGALRDPVTVAEGGEVYIFHPSAYSMALQKDAFLNGEYWEMGGAVSQGPGYTCIDPKGLKGELTVYLAYYYDYWYEVTLLFK
ncbi:MAG: hypothetical protein Q4C00_05270 [Bacillota bacterium]|nr:hypothetical protein [Bacillota bacterium]